MPAHKLSAAHIATCELDLARTYRRYGKVGMVQECATAVLAVTKNLDDSWASHRAEAWELLEWAENARAA